MLTIWRRRHALMPPRLLFRYDDADMLQLRHYAISPFRLMLTLR